MVSAGKVRLTTAYLQHLLLFLGTGRHFEILSLQNRKENMLTGATTGPCRAEKAGHPPTKQSNKRHTIYSMDNSASVFSFSPAG